MYAWRLTVPEGHRFEATQALRQVLNRAVACWYMTSMLHRYPDEGPFDVRLQLAQLEQVVSSRAAATALAESYVGLPIL